MLQLRAFTRRPRRDARRGVAAVEDAPVRVLARAVPVPVQAGDDSFLVDFTTI